MSEFFAKESADFDESPPLGGTGDPASGSRSLELPTGSGLGKYRILERVRTTRGAVVYKARDAMLDRLVSLKQMAPELIDDPIACGEFRREAQLMARCGHDTAYVVEIHELIEEDRGLFLVYDYLPGRWLESLIAKRQIDAERAVRIVGTLAFGLRAIHGQGVVHRDLRPANVFISEDVGAIIADLSCAALEGDVSRPRMETNKYIAPEMLLPGDYDDRVDIYALGMISYEICVGRDVLHRRLAAVTGDPATAEERWADWHRDLDEALPPVAELNPLVPPALAGIIDRMCAKSLDLRYVSIEDVVADMSRFLRSQRRDGKALPATVPRHGAGFMLPGPGRGQPATATLLTAVGGTRGVADTTTHRLARFGRTVALPAAAASSEEALPAAASASEEAVPAAAAGPPVWAASPADAASAAPPRASTSRVGLRSVQTRRQPVLRRRRKVVRAEDIPALDPVVSTLRDERLRKIFRYAVAAVILVTLTLGGAMGWQAYYGPRSYSAIQVIHGDAVRAYHADHYSEAHRLFGEVAAAAIGDELRPLRDSAQAWAFLCEARSALDRTKFSRAEERLRLAVQRGAGRLETDQIRRGIRAGRTAARIETRLNSGNLSGVRDSLAALERGGDPIIVQPLARRLRDRLDRVHDQQEQSLILNEAQAALDKGDFIAALLACARARRISDTRDARELERTVVTMKKRDDWIRRGDAAMIDNRHQEAFEAFETASKLKPSEGLERKLSEARAHTLLADARTAMEEGDLLLAERKLKNSVWYQPMPEAVSMLRASRPSFEAARVALRADRAVRSGDPNRAVSLYESALSSMPTTLGSARNRIRENLTRARWKADTQRGDRAAREGQWVAALSAYQAARRISRNDELDRKIATVRSKILQTARP